MVEPERHTCSPNAESYLRPIRFCGMWCWELHWSKRDRVLAVHCPWCGKRLPCWLVEAV